MLYCVKKGKHNFSPSDSGKCYKDFKKAKWIVTFKKEGEFDYKLEDGTLDNDWKDINKGGGFSLYDYGFNIINFIIRNRDNVMWGYRWNPLIKKWQVRPYSNIKGTNNYGYSDVNFLSGEKAIIEIENLDGKRYKVTILNPMTNQSSSNIIVHRKKWRRFSKIGIWHGGANNSRGEFGGTAPIDYCIDVEFSIDG